jgi:hypothetical protein
MGECVKMHMLSSTADIQSHRTTEFIETMKTHVLRGSKQEIAEGLARINGEVREVIVFEEEPVTGQGTSPSDVKDIFAEMRPLMVDVPDVDDSREAIYTRMEGE